MMFDDTSHNHADHAIIGIGVGQCGIRCALRTIPSDTNDIQQWIFVDSDPRSKSLFHTPQQLARFVYVPNAAGPGRVAPSSWEAAYANGAPAVQAVSQMIQRTVRGMTLPPAFVIFHALGGSTGSGLTSLLLERLRSMFPQIHIATVSVCGFRISPPLSKYHRVLCLRWLHMYADAIFLFENEELQHTWHVNHSSSTAGASASTPRQLRSGPSIRPKSKGETGPSLDSLNVIIRDRMRAVLYASRISNRNVQPEGTPVGPPYVLQPGLSRIISQVCPTLHAKILTVRTAHESIGDTARSKRSNGTGMRDENSCRWTPLTKKVVRQLVGWRQHKQATEHDRMRVDSDHLW
jgi:hypothetical protein